MSGSTRFAVAVHVLALLAYLERGGVTLVPSAKIARSVNTSPVVIRTLICALKKAGLVRSKEGKGGGVSLARAPARISLEDVFLAVEDERILAANRKPRFAPCPVSRGMGDAFQWVSAEVDGAVARALRTRTLQDVVKRL
jgi:Rrf2 family protein